ncbi:helix-turn-helix domain-containing protein [Flectobacillus roseus]|jgi:DNA-binding XRE family transcriptional regulator|uniref:helix-turn-helix domain-containing protein n=1 Tax=Flectobacillus roseus TaxID=502259 RepID=UPI0024B6A36A|nr:helix-turn-helix transcriptional regulator [Flectobacillus roseus]MDI9868393.1 helix-turn-helix transcriptional regulator [Flectobacillus roseus]
MNKLPRITKIVSIEPYKITVIWTTAEIRVIDFEPFFQQWNKNANEHLLALKDWEVFKNVAVSESKTLEWLNHTSVVNFRNKRIEVPTSLDPDVLYEQSHFIKNIDTIPVGVMLKEAREKAGLSQAEVALSAGTTRNYISRIENGKSDIQLETLHKIVALGLGKELKVEVVDTNL